MYGHRRKARQDSFIREFLTQLERISAAHRPYENFTNFLEAAYCAIAKRCASNLETASALEARYMTVAQLYARDPTAMTRMSEALGLLTLTLATYQGDFLGKLFMAADFGNRHKGQFFTPYDVASFMAQMTLDERELRCAQAQGRVLTLLDPACGSGTQIIAAADYITEIGLDVRAVLRATLVDVDRLAFQMAYLQMTLKGIPAICVHGNSLTEEEFERALTPAALAQLNALAQKANREARGARKDPAGDASDGSAAAPVSSADTVTPEPTAAREEMSPSPRLQLSLAFSDGDRSEGSGGQRAARRQNRPSRANARAEPERARRTNPSSTPVVDPNPATGGVRTPGVRDSAGATPAAQIRPPPVERQNASPASSRKAAPARRPRRRLGR